MLPIRYFRAGTSPQPGQASKQSGTNDRIFPFQPYCITDKIITSFYLYVNTIQPKSALYRIVTFLFRTLALYVTICYNISNYAGGMPMRLISWNVNGLRACLQKGFMDFFTAVDADVFCLQETKLQPDQISLDLNGYHQFWNSAVKKGYSGTAAFSKAAPLSVRYGVGVEELDQEGRLITLEYENFFLVTCYTPNAQRGLARLDHRMQWDDAFRAYLQELDKSKPVIACGDLNVAHKEIDLKNPASNRGNAGFSDEERDSFSKTLDAGFTDTFRYLHPDATGCYTWWSYMYKARQNNAGWRIDYFIVSDRIRDKIQAAPIYNETLGSDHCPIGLEIQMED